MRARAQILKIKSCIEIKVLTTINIDQLEIPIDFNLVGSYWNIRISFKLFVITNLNFILLPVLCSYFLLDVSQVLTHSSRLLINSTLMYIMTIVSFGNLKLLKYQVLDNPPSLIWAFVFIIVSLVRTLPNIWKYLSS